MRKLFMLGVGLLSAASLFGAIVNNSTSTPTAEDSLSFVFYSVDSLGNATTADSFYILVSGPSGGVAYKDSAAISDSRVSSITIRSKQFYSFKDQVSNLDGSGDAGSYCLTILTKKNTGGLLTPNVYSFQIVDDELSDQLALIGDSVDVKGGAVDSNRTELGGDSTLIAGWVWNTQQSSHTVSGSFGKYLDTEVSGVSSGSGAYSFTIQTYDSGVGLAIPYASLGVRSIDQSSLVAVGRSDNLGQASFNLDADSFLIVASASSYIFGSYDTVVVSGAGVDTIFCDQFDPGAPSFPTLCRVYGHLFTAGGVAEEGAAVSSWLPSGVARFGYAVISPTSVSSTSDSTGYFYLDLVPSGALTPANTEYEFTISRSDGTILRQRLAVPDSASWRLIW
jgi:hypothetical protein